MPSKGSNARPQKMVALYMQGWGHGRMYLAGSWYEDDAELAKRKATCFARSVAYRLEPVREGETPPASIPSAPEVRDHATAHS